MTQAEALLRCLHDGRWWTTAELLREVPCIVHSRAAHVPRSSSSGTAVPPRLRHAPVAGTSFDAGITERPASANRVARSGPEAVSPSRPSSNSSRYSDPAAPTAESGASGGRSLHTHQRGPLRLDGDAEPRHGSPFPGERKAQSPNGAEAAGEDATASEPAVTVAVPLEEVSGPAASGHSEPSVVSAALASSSGTVPLEKPPPSPALAGGESPSNGIGPGCADVHGDGQPGGFSSGTLLPVPRTGAPTAADGAPTLFTARKAPPWA